MPSSSRSKKPGAVAMQFAVDKHRSRMTSTRQPAVMRRDRGPARSFDVATEIALKAPVRFIARMVGVPPEAATVRARPRPELGPGRQPDVLRAQKTEQFVNDTLPGLQYILDMVTARRASGSPGDDFIGSTR